MNLTNFYERFAVTFTTDVVINNFKKLQGQILTIAFRCDINIAFYLFCTECVFSWCFWNSMLWFLEFSGVLTPDISLNFEGSCFPFVFIVYPSYSSGSSVVSQTCFTHLFFQIISCPCPVYMQMIVKLRLNGDWIIDWITTRFCSGELSARPCLRMG